MSKILYLTPPAHGHVNPTLPVVRELVSRGGQLICYNTDEFRPQLEQTGAVFRAYPSSELTSGEINRLVQDGNLANVTGLILKTTEKILPEIIAEFEREKPDLVVFDSLILWGKMAATQLKLRAAGSITHFVMDEKHMTRGDMFRMLRMTLPTVPGILGSRSRLIKRFGKAYPMTSPLFPMRDRMNIVFTLRVLQPDTPIIDDTFHFVGPSINLQTRTGDFPLDALGDKPLVYISFGTVHAPDNAFLSACFQAFADYPAQFVLSTGKTIDPAALPAPPNFIVRQTVAQLEILQRASVFITHAGMNSIHEALYNGVPLILIPQQFEQLLNARCVAARGAGYMTRDLIVHKPITAASLRQALSVVMTEPRFRQSAVNLQQALRASGGYRQAADEIQAYSQGE